MNADKKTKWVAALRSGEYEQGKGTLAQGDRYCCLGVLCDLAVKDGVEVRVYVDHDDKRSYDGQQGILPESVMQWAGLGSADPNVILGESDSIINADSDLVAGKCSLATLNDNGADFAFIADRIERDIS